MNKILLILKREFLTRVKKKSFLVMTILSPLLIVLFYGVTIYFTINGPGNEEVKTVFVDDASGLISNKLNNSKIFNFEYGTIGKLTPSAYLKVHKNLYAVLQIPDSFGLNNTKGIKFSAIDQPSISQIEYIEHEIEKYVKNEQLTSYKIDQNIINKINETKVSLSTVKLNLDNEKEEKSNSGAATALGMGGALLIYFFIFLYGVMVMKGIIEEKTNRIVEIIISSVRPFQLMMGKILGIASVGLLQFIIWVALILLAMPLVSNLLMGDKVQEITNVASQIPKNVPANVVMGNSFLDGLLSFNYPYLISVFIFYFITGYLFYGALFAAIGSAVDNETDTQQFMLPVTMPLVFSIALAQGLVLNSPNGAAAFWMSIIPFTSPVVMMIRLPFGVPAWELALSMALMIFGFMFTVWLASRIYRIGILTFGKKPTYKEIWKWIKMSN
ncbi:MAG: ABC transporter permease [Candidatus Methylacidiphilales bacterium]